MSKYTSEIALKELRSHDALLDFHREVHRKKVLWHILWKGDASRIATAVGATQYEDPSLAVPFGVQDELLRLGKVAEVLLLCSKWSHYYRIPAADFRKIQMTDQDGRRLFQVNSFGELCSEETVVPVNLARFKRKI